jgi:hypothetical protein
MPILPVAGKIRQLDQNCVFDYAVAVIGCIFKDLAQNPMSTRIDFSIHSYLCITTTLQQTIFESSLLAVF